MDIEDTRHQLDVIKRENFKYHLELTDKRKMILNLEKTIHSNQTYMSELRKNLSTLKLKCKRLEDKLRRVNQSLEHCDNNREQLTQLAQNLNTENTRRGIHYKKMEASLKKCEMEKYHILNQAESQNKKVYQEEVRNKDLQSEINRLFFELSASRQLEDNMAKVLDKANKQILSLKNKLYISEAKANSGVAELNHQKNMLHTAKTHAENLGKNMQNLLTELKAVYYRMTSCTNENIEKKNIIRHMDALCHNFKNVIRIQDSENDSLVISSQKLEQLLRKSHDNMLVLRQKNAEAATEAHLQAELFSMLKYMLRFTETEKDTAVKIACKADHSIILLKQESAKRMHEILKLSEDVYAQKMLVKNFVKTLEHEKHENSHLIQMLHEADIEQQGLKRNYYALLQERDAFGVMVIQGRTRNDLLAKKMDAVYALLKAGFLESQQQIMDMRILKLEILNLRRKLQAYKGINFINNELRIELVDASRALQLEQDKRAAIEKMKMQVPHLHRYIQQARLSEYEMIQKIQKLQKMLIIKYKEISSRDNVIQRRNKALLELKLLLAKRPGVACYGELRATKSLLTKKDKEIKSLLAELNASRYEIHSKEQALEKLLAQMRSDKRQLAEYKRRAVGLLGAEINITSDIELLWKKNMPTLDVKQSAELSKRKLLSGCLTLNVTKPNLIKSTLTPLNLTSNYCSLQESLCEP
nr:cilia- and flagella-associated protein 58-like [Biomphalaria glabrata]